MMAVPIAALVTRHPGALASAIRRDLPAVVQQSHLDPAVIQTGDVVIGTLPVPLAAEVCQRGARYCNLTLDLPEAMRGQELSADELSALGARLEEFRVVSLAPPSNRS